MTSVRLQTAKFGTIAVQREINRAGEGRIFATSNQSLLLKVYDPRDSDVDLPVMQAAKRRAYQTFANLKLDGQPELSCLPLEYVALPSGEPAYVMRLADGNSLDSIKNSARSGTPLIERLQMAQALATAMQGLHSAQIVHADVKWENYFITRLSNGYRVFVLDIDAGGYRGPVVSGRYEKLLPTALPDGMFRPPEFIQSITWGGLWETSWAFQPDLWALAVMLFCIVVDPDGPFPLRPTRDLGKGMPAYVPYKRRDIIDAVSWPKDWQAALMQQQCVPQTLVDAFSSVFSSDRDVTKRGKPRLSASDWKMRLQRSVTDLEQASLRNGTSAFQPRTASNKGGVVTVQVRTVAGATQKPVAANTAAVPIPVVATTAAVTPSSTTSHSSVPIRVQHGKRSWQWAALMTVIAALLVYLLWQAISTGPTMSGAGQMQAVTEVAATGRTPSLSLAVST